MKKTILLLFLVVLVPVTSWGGTILEWVAPTAYTDGSPILSGEIDSFLISCGTQSGIYNTEVSVGGLATTYQISDDLPRVGTFFCALKVRTTNGGVSAYSNEVTFPLVDSRIPEKGTLRVRQTIP